MPDPMQAPLAILVDDTKSIKSFHTLPPLANNFLPIYTHKYNHSFTLTDLTTCRHVSKHYERD